jgi:hypothetical protein
MGASESKSRKNGKVISTPLCHEVIVVLSVDCEGGVVVLLSSSQLRVASRIFFGLAISGPGSGYY